MKHYITIIGITFGSILLARVLGLSDAAWTVGAIIAVGGYCANVKGGAA